jgi:photosystem II stability/assembly factor-like uncharacterized protein
MKTKTCGRFGNWGVPGLLLALVVIVSPEYAFGQTSNCGVFPVRDLYSVHFIDANKGVVVGANKTLCLTNNGGAFWQPTTLPPLPPAATFYDVQFISATQGWVVGSGGTILTTTNGGITWVAQKSNTTYALRAVYFVNASIGWAVGDADSVLKTTNGGATWVAQSAGPFGSVYDIYCMSPTLCRIVGSSSGGSLPAKFTNDGGKSWRVVLWAKPQTLFGVHFALNPAEAFAVGVGGVLHRANANGMSWSEENSSTRAWLYSPYCVNGSTCWIVGSQGTILKGPGSWVAQKSGTTATLYKVYFVDANRGWAVGSGRTVRKTINGGATWTNSW